MIALATNIHRSQVTGHRWRLTTLIARVVENVHAFLVRRSVTFLTKNIVTIVTIVPLVTRCFIDYECCGEFSVVARQIPSNYVDAERREF